MENVPGMLSLDGVEFVKAIYQLFEGAGNRMRHMVLCPPITALRKSVGDADKYQDVVNIEDVLSHSVGKPGGTGRCTRQEFFRVQFGPTLHAHAATVRIDRCVFRQRACESVRGLTALT
jgi:hypothetical protein